MHSHVEHVCVCIVLFLPKRLEFDSSVRSDLEEVEQPSLGYNSTQGDKQ